jgi:hypothetical protein
MPSASHGVVHNIAFVRCAATSAAHAQVNVTESVAAMARKAGIPHVSVVSAQGANANMIVDPWELIHPLLYIRTLGRKEAAVLGKGFSKVSLFRPGPLDRLVRDRFFETIMTAFGIGLRVDTLASAMIVDAESASESAKEPFIFEGNGAIEAVLKK